MRILYQNWNIFVGNMPLVNSSTVQLNSLILSLRTKVFCCNETSILQMKYNRIFHDHICLHILAWLNWLTLSMYKNASLKNQAHLVSTQTRNGFWWPIKLRRRDWRWPNLDLTGHILGVCVLLCPTKRPGWSHLNMCDAWDFKDAAMAIFTSGGRSTSWSDHTQCFFPLTRRQGTWISHLVSWFFFGKYNTPK